MRRRRPRKPRVRVPGHTTAEGYGYEHQQLRRGVEVVLLGHELVHLDVEGTDGVEDVLVGDDAEPHTVTSSWDGAYGTPSDSQLREQ